MSTHTPGPWYADGRNIRARSGGHVGSSGGDFYDDGRRDRRGSTITPILDTTANARLMAAAPELLAAAKLVLKCGSKPVDESYCLTDAYCAALESLKDAVATAEGSNQ